MRILITGALGFTARYLTRRLRAREVFIAGTDLVADQDTAKLDAYVPAEITDAQAVTELICQFRPDWIFHLAGLFRGNAPQLYSANLMSTLHLLEAVKTHLPGCALLLAGSAAEYGIWPATEMPLAEHHCCQPVGPYGMSKHAMTVASLDYARNAKLKLVVARPFNLLGAGMPSSLVIGAVAQRAKAALANGQSSIAIGNMRARRDFIAVEDAVEAYVRLLECGPWGEVVNVCSGQDLLIGDLVQRLLSLSPRPLSAVEDPSLSRAGDPLLAVGDASKINRLCGFAPRISLERSLHAIWHGDAEPKPSSVAGIAR